MVEDRSIELTTLSPAGTTPARAEFFPIPIGDTPWSWEQEPTLNDIQTMTEYTLPVAKLSKRFGQLLNLHLESIPIISGTHGLRSIRVKFKKYDKNKKRMGEDFEAYKKSPWIHLLSSFPSGDNDF